MIRRHACVLALALGGMLAATPAHGCSWSYAPGQSPAEIRARHDVRRIHGAFQFDRAASDADGDGLLDGPAILGRVVSETGRSWDTTHFYSEFAADCGIPVGPTGDAAGTFWITRSRSGGRYVLRSWEPAPAPRPTR